MSLMLAVDFPKQVASFENLNLYKILQIHDLYCISDTCSSNFSKNSGLLLQAPALKYGTGWTSCILQ